MRDRLAVDVPAAVRRARALVQALDDALGVVEASAPVLPASGEELGPTERIALATQLRADLMTLTAERDRVAAERADWATRSAQAGAQDRPDLEAAAQQRATARAALVAVLDAELAQLHVVAARCGVSLDGTVRPRSHPERVSGRDDR